MKNYLILFLFVLMMFTSQAQTAGDVFNKSTNITWLGLDFTGAHFVGDNYTWQNGQHIEQVIESINNLLIKEAPKYNVAKALDKPETNNQLQVTLNHNKKLKLDDLLSDPKGALGESDIQEIINMYDFEGQKGIGVIFNIELFDKTAEQAVMWITFVNMDTKQVLFTEKSTQKPGGIGLRNYWASTVYKSIKYIEDNHKKWSKKYR